RGCASGTNAAARLAIWCSVTARLPPRHFAKRRRNMIRMSALICALALVGTAQAQGVVTTKKVSAAIANELVGESVAQCVRNGYKVVAVVVDTDGLRQAMLRGDGAPIHSVDNAFYKAY